MIVISVHTPLVAATSYTVEHSTSENFQSGTLENLSAANDEVKLSTISLNWAQATSAANWSIRYDHASEVYNSKMWVIGGYASDGPYKNDVWYSSDGITWTRSTASAQWATRQGHAVLNFNDWLYILGGDNGTIRYNDVYYSYSADASYWYRATDNALWSARADHTALVYDGKMWVLGGKSGITYYNDVWYSTGGVTWSAATYSANWSARYAHTSLVFNNKMWVLGGKDSVGYKSDVWYSSDGITWTEATSAAGWPGRKDFTAVVYDNKMWILGGDNGAKYMNDVWYSEDGFSWTQTTASWSARDGHSSVVYGDKIWVFGGYGTAGRNNEAWYAAPVYSQSGIITSDVLATEQNIAMSTVVWNASTPVNTTLAFELSNDNGTTWESVDNNIQHNFTSLGSALKYKGTFSTSNTTSTPILYDINIVYITNVAPNIPENLSPSARQISTTVTISADVWDNNSDSINVLFYTSDSVLIDNIWVSGPGGTAQVNWSGLTRGQTYTFHVLSQDEAGVSSENSLDCSFTVNSLPTAAIVYPSDGSSSIPINPALDWEFSDTDGDTQSKYYVLLDNDNDFTEVIENSGEVSSNSTQYGVIITLEYVTTYYWKLSVYDGYEWSDWQDARSFTTLSSNNTPVVPENLSPSSRQTSTDVAISAEVFDGDGDDINVYFYNSETGTIIDNVWVSGGNGTASVSWSGLTRGSTYSFHVNCFDSVDWSENSSQISFVVNTQPFTKNLKIEGESDPVDLAVVSPTFSWSYCDTDLDIQENFHIQVGTVENGYDMWDYNVQDNTYSIKYSGTTLVGNVTYYWRLEVYDGYEWDVMWVDGGTFSIAEWSVSIVSSPAGSGSTSGSGDYTHESSVSLAATASDGYQFSSWSGDVTSSSNPYSFTITSDKNIVANFTAITSPPPSSPSGGDGGSGPINILPVVEIVSPVNNTILRGVTNIIFSGEDSNIDFVIYTIKISVDNGQTWQTDNQVTYLERSSQSIHTLSVDTTKYASFSDQVRVKIIANDGDGSVSASSDVLINNIPTVPIPSNQNVFKISPTLEWSSSDALLGIVNYTIQIGQDIGFSNTETIILENSQENYLLLDVQEGVYYYRVMAISPNDVCSEWSSTSEFILDTTAPVLSESVTGVMYSPGIYSDKIVINITASDMLSGVKRLVYGVDNKYYDASAVNGSISVLHTIEGVGEHTIEYFAEDSAGNVSQLTSYNVNIIESPSIINVPDGNGVKISVILVLLIVLSLIVFIFIKKRRMNLTEWLRHRCKIFFSR